MTSVDNTRQFSCAADTQIGGFLVPFMTVYALIQCNPTEALLMQLLLIE